MQLKKDLKEISQVDILKYNYKVGSTYFTHASGENFKNLLPKGYRRGFFVLFPLFRGRDIKKTLWLGFMIVILS